jgi:hypothetical protein
MQCFLSVSSTYKATETRAIETATNIFACSAESIYSGAMACIQDGKYRSDLLSRLQYLDPASFSAWQTFGLIASVSSRRNGAGFVLS